VAYRSVKGAQVWAIGAIRRTSESFSENRNTHYGWYFDNNCRSLISVVLWIDISSVYCWIALSALIGFGLIGAADDILKIKKHSSDGLSVVQKLILQFIVSTIIVYSIYRTTGPSITKLYVPFFKVHVVDLGVYWLPIAIIYVATWSNAVNITDGLDGLAVGLVIFAVLALSLHRAICLLSIWADPPSFWPDAA